MNLFIRLTVLGIIMGMGLSTNSFAQKRKLLKLKAEEQEKPTAVKKVCPEAIEISDSGDDQDIFSTDDSISDGNIHHDDSNLYGEWRKHESCLAPLTDKQKTEMREMILNNFPRKGGLYTINLFWVNKSRNNKYQYIFPTQIESSYEYGVSLRDKNGCRAVEKEIYEKFLSHIFEWAQKNPEGLVQVWYDSEMTTKAALNRTRDKIAETPNTNIRLRDIRSLSMIQDKPNAFCHSIPVYFRADLGRIIIGLNDLKEGVDLSIYTDFDITPFSNEELFNVDTQFKLAKYGFVFGAEGNGNIGAPDEYFFRESYQNNPKQGQGALGNNFFIFSNKCNSVDTAFTFYANLMLEKATANHTEMYKHPSLVYEQLPLIIMLIHYLEKRGDIVFLPDTLKNVFYAKDADGEISEELKNAIFDMSHKEVYLDSHSRKRLLMTFYKSDEDSVINYALPLKKVFPKEIHPLIGKDSVYRDTWYN